MIGANAVVVVVVVVANVRLNMKVTAIQLGLSWLLQLACSLCRTSFVICHYFVEEIVFCGSL